MFQVSGATAVLGTWDIMLVILKALAVEPETLEAPKRSEISFTYVLCLDFLWSLDFGSAPELLPFLLTPRPRKMNSEEKKWPLSQVIRAWHFT